MPSGATASHIQSRRWNSSSSAAIRPGAFTAIDRHAADPQQQAAKRPAEHRVLAHPLRGQAAADAEQDADHEVPVGRVRVDQDQPARLRRPARGRSASPSVAAARDRPCAPATSSRSRFDKVPPFSTARRLASPMKHPPRSTVAPEADGPDPPPPAPAAAVLPLGRLAVPGQRRTRPARPRARASRDRRRARDDHRDRRGHRRCWRGSSSCNRRAHAEHDALVDRVARWLLAQKRLVFRGIALRTRLDERWALSKPDVFSLRHATARRRLQPGRARDQSAPGGPARRPQEGRQAAWLPVVLADVPLRDRRGHRRPDRDSARTAA